MTAENTEIPFSIKEKLLGLAEKLPENRRSEFISKTSARLKTLGLEYENTLMYAVVGWVLGEILEHFMTIPFTHLGMVDGASEAGGLIGGLVGLLKDRKAKAKEIEQAKKIAEIVRQELFKASEAKA